MRWLWHPVHAVCNKVFHPGRGSHHRGVTVSHIHWVDVIAGVYPRGPDSPIHGLRMVRWHLLHAELHEQLPLCLGGENTMVQQAVSHVFSARPKGVLRTSSGSMMSRLYYGQAWPKQGTAGVRSTNT